MIERARSSRVDRRAGGFPGDMEQAFMRIARKMLVVALSCASGGAAMAAVLAGAERALPRVESGAAARAASPAAKLLADVRILRAGASLAPEGEAKRWLDTFESAIA